MTTPTTTEEQLTRDEANVPYAYKDSKGYWTIGIGFLIDKDKGGGLRPEEISFILANRMKIHEAAIRKALPWYDSLDDARKGVLRNMAYQMGVEGLLGFKNTLAKVQAGRYEEASEMMMLSKWATSDSPERAKRLAKQMKEGTWQ